MSEGFKYTLDGVAIANVLATLANILPPLAALMSIIWIGIQIYSHFKKKD